MLLAALAVSPALAQEPTPVIPDDAVNAIAKGLYCPVCENIPLDVCGTQACYQWRELIREKLAQGWSEKEIKDYFVQQYGDRVLAEPPRRGLNWLVYILPPLAVLLAVWLAFRVLRTWGGAQPQAASSLPAGGGLPDPQDEEYIHRLEEELRQRD